MLIDRTHHPAFWRFTGVGVDNSGVFGACPRTFATKGVSCCTRGATACCFAPGNTSVDVLVAEGEAREDGDVWEVVMSCERIKGQSEAVIVVDWMEGWAG